MIYKTYEHYAERGITAVHFDHCRQNHLPIVINSYKDAKDWWDGRAGEEFRGTNDRPVGKRERSGFRMRMRGDKAIVFERDGIVISTWCPDGTLDVCAPETFTWGLNQTFEKVVLPPTVEYDRNTNYGRVAKLKRASAPDDYVTLTDGRQVANPDTLVIRCDKTVNLTYNSENERWEPTDPDDLDCFEWFELNKSELRAASQRYNVTEFVCAIEAMMQMGVEVKNAGASKSKWSSLVDHQVDGKSVLELLEERRYTDAARLVRVHQEYRYDAAAGRSITETKGLRQADIKMIRHLAYREMGVTYLEQRPIITLPMLGNVENKIRDFGKPITDRVL